MSVGTTDLATEKTPARTSLHHRRCIIGIMLLLMITIGYIDRMTLSIAGPVVAKEFNLAPFTLGLLFSAFFWGYAAMMVPGGWFIDTFGKRILLPVAVFGWTVVSVSTAFMSSIGGLFSVRILLGVGEAPAYPTGNLVIREWVPLKERGVYTSLMQTGTLLGPGVATAPAAWIVASYGWRSAFIILSSLGFVWLVGWLLLYRSPEKARWLTDDERQFIIATREQPEPAASTGMVRMSIPTLLQHRSMLGIMAANGAQTYAAYFLLTWLPSYLISARQFDLAHSGNLTSAMYLFATVATILLGRGADRWLSLSDERAKRGERRLVVAALMIASIIALTIAPWVANQYLLVLTIGVALTVIMVSIALTFATLNDLIVDETSAGRTFSLMSFSGQVIGLLAPIVTGWIVGLGAGFTVVFIVTAVLLAVGTLAAWVLPTRQLQPATR
jgi:MFS family permease